MSKSFNNYKSNINPNATLREYRAFRRECNRRLKEIKRLRNFYWSHMNLPSATVVGIVDTAFLICEKSNSLYEDTRYLYGIEENLYEMGV